MEERIRIATPDNVALDFDLAGPGSRFVALLLDTIVWILMMLALLLLYLLLASWPLAERLDSLGAWQTAIFVFVFFLTRWGYFILFETCLRGQTPGKRWLGLRVVRDNGLPPGFRRLLIRNLLRVADMLPPPTYLLGGVAVVLSRKGQRLGDMAAGTLVVRERYGRGREKERTVDYGAGWISKLERGQSEYAVVLPKGKISIRQIALIEEYFKRKASLTVEQRARLAWQIARPILPLFDREAGIRPGAAGPSQYLGRSEALLQEVLALARKSAVGAADPRRVNEDVEKKARTWSTFAARTEQLLRRGKRGLRKLSAAEMKSLLVDHRRITTDLARAQSMKADQRTLSELNRLAIGGHNIVYGYVKRVFKGRGRAWPALFAREVRNSLPVVALSAFLFFGALLVSCAAVRWHPELAWELVGPEFYDFTPASDEKLHDIPKIIRPVAASSILTNNLQVTILAFAFGITAGLGTAFLLVYNGIHLGSVIGWMSLGGNARALWGWVMPHGVTEITAVIIAGAAGFLLARAILMPGELRRSAALRIAAGKALVLELGCMAMLVVAGLIEGFVSPSRIGYPLRLLILTASVVLWPAYFFLAGRKTAVLEG
jgi:uncharacterized membrane protein SpoIIM required for sporulation/uncharacterized RDD family membrane protein YckC